MDLPISSSAKKSRNYTDFGPNLDEPKNKRLKDKTEASLCMSELKNRISLPPLEVLARLAEQLPVDQQRHICRALSESDGFTLSNLLVDRHGVKERHLRADILLADSE